MRGVLLGTAVFLLFFSFSSALSIVPLEAGSLVVQDKFLRLNTCIFKNVDLDLTREEYQKDSDIQVIAGLSNLKMNNQLAFQFFYKIGCPHSKCQLQFTIERITPVVSHLFDYELTIDYLVARGLKTIEVNMTNNHQTFTSPTINAEHKSIVDQEEEIFQQEKREWIAIGVPNGFNDMSLTGGIKITKLQQSDTFLMKHFRSEGSISRQWTLNQNFVFYKVIFLLKEDLALFNQKRTFSAFTVFKSTLETEVISVQVSSKQIQLHSIPLTESESFIDKRTPLIPLPSMARVESHNASSYLIRIMIGVICLGVMEFVYLLYRNRAKLQRREKGYKQSLQMPDIIISFNLPIVMRDENVADVATKTQSESEMARNANDI